MLLLAFELMNIDVRQDKKHPDQKHRGRLRLEEFGRRTDDSQNNGREFLLKECPACHRELSA